MAKTLKWVWICGETRTGIQTYAADVPGGCLVRVHGLNPEEDAQSLAVVFVPGCRVEDIDNPCRPSGFDDDEG